MSGADEEATWVALEFQEMLLADRAQGSERPLADYLARFPGHEETVAREWARAQPSEPTTSDAPGITPSSPTTVGARPPAAPPGAAEEATGRLGPYALEGEIGRGGQGVVYRARDTRLGRTVALKVLSALHGADRRLLSRFRREATVASSLEHPGICTVYELGEDQDTPFIAMRLVEGRSLADWLTAEGPAEPGALATEVEADTGTTGAVRRAEEARIHRFIGIVASAAEALAAAHEAGVVHRDLKPANIMVTPEGDGVLTDFGLARMEDSGHTLTASGELFGTPAYLSPEQLRGTGTIDHRVDIWALGVLLHEGLARQHPFPAATREALYRAVLEDEPPALERVNPQVPRDLAVVVRTALAKDPDRRYRTARALAEDLRRWLEGLPVLARPASRLEKLARWARRNPALATSLGAALLFLSVGLATSLSFQREARLEAAHAREESAAKDRALARYEQMSDSRLARRLLEEAERLHPAEPFRLPAMGSWLERTDALLARRDRHERALAELGAAADTGPEARAAAERALLRGRHPDLVAELERFRERERRFEASEPDAPELEEIRARIRQLEADPRIPRPAEPAFTDLSLAWRHAVLSMLVADLDRLAAERSRVHDRAERAAALPEISIETQAARAAWKACLDDLAASETYGEITAEPVVGLLPLGKDADSGLWEFWHVGSGRKPRWEGSLASGRVQLARGDGLVLVLVPGGSYRLGAQRRDPDAPHHDPMANSWEVPPFEVRLDPFLIGKYEVTQDQWVREMGANPSFYQPGLVQGEEAIGWLNPVEQISRRQAGLFAWRLGLELPTEARWEAAHRGGTATVYWSGDAVASLQGAANVSDLSAHRVNLLWEHEPELDDGFAGHAPVGRFRANPFGLHDTAGNVWEWCKDRSARLSIPPRPGDGFRVDDYAAYYTHRGGCYRYPADPARSAARGRADGEAQNPLFGLRLARSFVSAQR